MNGHIMLTVRPFRNVIIQMTMTRDKFLFLTQYIKVNCDKFKDISLV